MVGLKLAELIGEVTVDWVPPKKPEPPVVKIAEVEEPPPEKQDDPKKEPGKPKVPVNKRGGFSVRIAGGSHVAGDPVIFGPRVSLGLGHEWGGAEKILPISVLIDVDFRWCRWDLDGREVTAIMVTSGLYAQARLPLGDVMSVSGAVGYRLGWAQLAGKSDVRGKGLTLHGLWNGPAVRLGAGTRLNHIDIAIEFEGGYNIWPIVGELGPDSDVEIGSLWASAGLTLSYRF